MKSAADMRYRRRSNRLLPALRFVSWLWLLLCAFAEGQNERKVAFRVLCLEHRDGITHARIDAGKDSGKSHEIILLTGNFTDEYKSSFADNAVRFYVADASKPDGRRLVAAGPLAQGERQLFLLLPESDGSRPYRVFAFNDDESVFPMGAIRVLNLCPVMIRLNLAGADMKPIQPGKVAIYPPVRQIDEWNMYQVRIDFANAKGDWVPVSSPSWKSSALKRDLVITLLDPVSHDPRIASYKDLPPWHKPQLDKKNQPPRS